MIRSLFKNSISLFKNDTSLFKNNISPFKNDISIESINIKVLLLKYRDGEASSPSFFINNEFQKQVLFVGLPSNFWYLNNYYLTLTIDLKLKNGLFGNFTCDAFKFTLK